MIALLLLAQSATTDYWNIEEHSFEPYRKCMLTRAAELASSAGEISGLEAAARSKCRSELIAVEADVALDAAAIETEESSGKHVLDDPAAHLAQMKEALSDDFAAAVLDARKKNMDQPK
jgi:hypothetical protein